MPICLRDSMYALNKRVIFYDAETNTLINEVNFVQELIMFS